jgi:hypothetical protein
MEALSGAGVIADEPTGELTEYAHKIWNVCVATSLSTLALNF